MVPLLGSPERVVSTRLLISATTLGRAGRGPLAQNGVLWDVSSG